MELVAPIKEIEMINAIKQILRESSFRDYLLFVLGVNTGMKNQDLLFLKVEDVWDGRQAKKFLNKNENTGGTESFYLNSQVREAVQQFLEKMDSKQTEYLFKSKKDDLPITRQQAYRIINQAAKKAGLKDKIGILTLRKTFGYHAYKKGVAISNIMSILNQTSQKQTLRFIGIENEFNEEMENDPILIVNINL